MFEYLHLDVIPIIFSYLSQYELLSILLTNKLIYYQIMKYINTTKFICIESNDKLEHGCKNNLIISIKQIKIQLYWNYGLDSACEGGHEFLVKLMIEKGANNWNYGLYGACFGGQESFVKLMIEKGANNWNYGLYYACKGGHESIVKLMIEKGANDWNRGLSNACKGSHSKNKNFLNSDVHSLNEQRHESIVKLMIDKGATYCDYCNKSIKNIL